MNGRLDQKKAANLLYGLQLAAQFIDRKKFFYAPDAVQSAEQDSQGSDLAPDKYVCADKDDCDDCPYSDACPRCVSDDDGLIVAHLSPRSLVPSFPVFRSLLFRCNQ